MRAHGRHSQRCRSRAFYSTSIRETPTLRCLRTPMTHLPWGSARQNLAPACRPIPAGLTSEPSLARQRIHVAALPLGASGYELTMYTLKVTPKSLVRARHRVPISLEC